MNAKQPLPRRAVRRRVAALLAALALAAPVAGAETPEATPRFLADGDAWELRPPRDDKLLFQGVVNSDDGTGRSANGMMYPAPNLVGFLASVVVHGLIESGAQQSQRSSQQRQADRVLAPYQPVLEGLSAKAVMAEALEAARVPGTSRLLGSEAASSGAATPGTWWIESQPVFSMTQDQTAIVLDHALQVHAPGDASAEGTPVVVRVVSLPQPSSSMPAHWSDHQGENLRRETVRLLAESLDLALGSAAVAAAQRGAEPHKTVRYTFGSAEKMERGQVVAESCERIVIRTLRGWLMSVPRRGAVPAGCPAPALPAPAGVEGVPVVPPSVVAGS